MSLDQSVKVWCLSHVNYLGSPAGLVHPNTREDSTCMPCASNLGTSLGNLISFRNTNYVKHRGKGGVCTISEWTKFCVTGPRLKQCISEAMHMWLELGIHLFCSTTGFRGFNNKIIK